MSDTPKFVCKRGKDERFCTLKKAVTSTADKLEIPKYADGRYITVIGSGAFKKCPRVKTIVLPETVTEIAAKAFAGSNIEEIVIPSTVTAIGDRAFDKCVYLRRIEIENPDAKIGKSLFSGCYNITRAKLPVSAFTERWFTTLEETIAIGNGELPENAFKDCGRLKFAALGEGITSIGEHAFSDCGSLERIELPESLEEICSYAFLKCAALSSFTVPKGVKTIEWEVFSGCALESLRVDKENEVFHSDGNCIIRTNEKQLVAGCADSIIPKDGSVETIYDWAFSECKDLSAIVIPSSVKHIGDDAFCGCKDLENIVLSEGLETISDFAFCECSRMESIEIPSTVKELGFGIFDECESLSDVYYNGTVAEWREIETDAHLAGNSSFVLHCSDGDIDDYKE